MIRLYVAWPRLRHHEALLDYARKAVVSVAIDQGRLRSSGDVVGLPANRPDPPSTDPTNTVLDRLVLMERWLSCHRDSARASCCATTRTSASRPSPTCSAANPRR